MSRLSVVGGRALSGQIEVPPDKSIFHRAVFLSAIAEGTSKISPLSLGADNQSSISVIQTLGVRVRLNDESAELLVDGRGHPRQFLPGPRVLDCGNSGTTMRMVAGMLAASASSYVLVGDPSLSARPMARLLPLTEMGARLSGEYREGRIYPPLTIEGASLRGGRFVLPVASAQVKSALLLAGLFADGPTEVKEPARSRDHTERMLSALGVQIETLEDDSLRIHPREAAFRSPRFLVPPDFSSAAFLLGAAVLTESPEVWVKTGINPTRTGFLDALRAFGVKVHERAPTVCSGEPVAEVSVSVPSTGLVGAELRGELCLRALDEIPLIAALAAFAEGPTRIRDAAELRVKESDRLQATASLLRSFGAEVTEVPDGLDIEGARGRLRPGPVHPAEDHRLVMAAAVMGLALPGMTTVHGADIIAVSYPSFAADLRRLGAEVLELEPVSDPVR